MGHCVLWTAAKKTKAMRTQSQFIETNHVTKLARKSYGSADSSCSAHFNRLIFNLGTGSLHLAPEILSSVFYFQMFSLLT